MENENIRAEMIELTEFPQIAQKYRVMGVPKTMINGEHGLDGAVPEAHLVTAIVDAAG